MTNFAGTLVADSVGVGLPANLHILFLAHQAIIIDNST